MILNLFPSSVTQCLSIKNNFLSKADQDEFQAIYPEIIQDITSIDHFHKLPDFASSVKSMLDHNLTPKYNANGLITVYAFKMIAKPEQRTPENIKLAILLGWCVRLVSKCFKNY